MFSVKSWPHNEQIVAINAQFIRKTLTFTKSNIQVKNWGPLQMNKLWQLTRNLLRKRLLVPRPTFNVRKLSSLLAEAPKKRFVPLSIAGTIIPYTKTKLEDDVFEAFVEGEAAIIDIMNELRKSVVAASKEYRDCLAQQIDLIKRTGDVASEALPEFRLLASELSTELNEYVILLKTIGEIAYDRTVMGLMLEKNSLETILKKYKELEILLLQEFEANKRKELELLEVNIANMKIK